MAFARASRPPRPQPTREIHRCGGFVRRREPPPARRRRVKGAVKDPAIRERPDRPRHPDRTGCTHGVAASSSAETVFAKVRENFRFPRAHNYSPTTGEGLRATCQIEPRREPRPSVVVRLGGMRAFIQGAVSIGLALLALGCRDRPRQPQVRTTEPGHGRKRIRIPVVPRRGPRRAGRRCGPGSVGDARSPGHPGRLRQHRRGIHRRTAAGDGGRGRARWQFINWYFHEFVGSNPFGHSSTNLGSLYKASSRTRPRRSSTCAAPPILITPLTTLGETRRRCFT